MDSEIKQSLRRHVSIVFFTAVVLMGGMVVIAAFVEITGAVVASGRIVVQSHVKSIQHQNGGIVQEIYVQEGQVVSAGDLLLRLDDTVLQANHAISAMRLQDLQLTEARLTAERDGTSFQPPADAKDQAAAAGQKALLSARRKSRKGRKAQLSEQIEQLEARISGLVAQKKAKNRQMVLIQKEWTDLSTLRDKGLIRQSRITALERETARLEGEHGEIVSGIAEAEQVVSEIKLQILQIDEDFHADAVEQLQTVRVEILKILEQKAAVAAELKRIKITAPSTGTIHQLTVHTIGAVVAGGEELMKIVPRDDHLIVEAHVAPNDIEQLVHAQTATVRFPSFEQRTTPELEAMVERVSADLIEDARTGQLFYKATLSIPETELGRLGGKSLLPGMPVEAFVQTNSRTILSYIGKPLSDHIARAFKER